MSKEDVKNIIDSFNSFLTNCFGNVHQNFSVVLRFTRKHFRYLEKLYFGIRNEFEEVRIRLSKQNQAIDKRINQTQNQLDKLLKIIKNKRNINAETYPIINWTIEKNDLRGTWFNHVCLIQVEPFFPDMSPGAYAISIDSKHYLTVYNKKQAKQIFFDWCKSQIRNNLTIYLRG